MMYMGAAPQIIKTKEKQNNTPKSVEVLRLLSMRQDSNNFYVRLVDAFLEGRKQKVYEVLESNYEKLRNLDARYLKEIKEAKIRTWNDRISALEILEKAYGEAIKKDGYARDGIEVLVYTYQAIKELVLTPYKELSEPLKAVLKAKNLTKAYTALRNKISVSKIYHLIKDKHITHLKHKYGIKERNIEPPSLDYQQPAEEEKYRKVLEIAGLYQAFFEVGLVAKRNGHTKTEEKERKAIECIKHVGFIYVPDNLLEYDSQPEKLKKEVASIYDVLTQREVETSKLIQKLKNLKDNFPVEHKHIYKFLVKGIAYGLSSEVDPNLIYKPDAMAEKELLQLIEDPKPKTKEKVIRPAVLNYTYQIQSRAIQPRQPQNEQETWIRKIKNLIKSPWKVAAGLATLAGIYALTQLYPYYKSIYESIENHLQKPKPVAVALHSNNNIQKNISQSNKPVPSIEELYIKVLDNDKNNWEWDPKVSDNASYYLSTITLPPAFNPSNTSPK